MPRAPAYIQVLQYSAESVDDNPTFATVTVKESLSIAVSVEKVPLSASEKFNVYGHGPMDLSVTGTLKTDIADPSWAALQVAHAAGTVLGFWALDSLTGAGWQFDGIIVKFDHGGGRSDPNNTEIEIAPAPNGVEPAWVAK